MPADIILIGPVRTGKSTLSRLLAEKLGVPNISLDELRWRYYAEIGYDEALARHIRQTGGFVALVFYWKLFDAHAVERVLSEHQNCIFNFGAGHTVNENSELFARVQRALTDYDHVILILPSPDAQRSIEILNERTQDLVGSFGQGFDWNTYFVQHPANRKLAKFVVYTEGKSPEETRDEILDLVYGADKAIP
ncbi:MAG: shikimate kinase [Ardenticatenales bacterium]|nr:shikimate kinase [Ardenticatenales bacterium]